MIHKLPVRIYFEDTDAGGIVYHASHIRFCERGRTELIRDLGWTNSQVKEEFNTMFVVRHMDVNYLRPSYLDDMLELQTAVVEIKRTSFVMEQNLFKGEDKIFSMKVVLACVNDQGKLVKIPEKLSVALQE